MSQHRLRLERVPGAYAVCRLAAGDPVPAWAAGSGTGSGNGGGGGAGGPGLLSVTRTERELSIVAPEAAVPAGVRAERGWLALRVAGTLDFGLVGVLSRLTGALAGAGVPVFVLSTFDTDVLLVKQADLPRAVEALAAVADCTGL